jgi:uncharacterized protein (TIGR00369 family)
VSVERRNDGRSLSLFFLAAPLPDSSVGSRVVGVTTPDAASFINTLHAATFAGELGITTASATRDEVIATLTVRASLHQPHGIVHGGVYSTIVETLASVGAALDAAAKGKTVVGLENHTSFVRAVREGVLHARATPITRGRRTQLWEVVVKNDAGEVAATGRVRLLVLDEDSEVGGARIGAGMSPSGKP